MKKLITLANFATGTVKNIVTGEVKTVDTNLSEKERIKLMAKTIAELHNAGVKKLLKKKKLSRKEWDTEMAKKYKSMRWHNH
jgi:CBS domain-containing protein